MKLSKLLHIDIQSLVLFIIVPVLTILISFMAWLSYDEMYDTILDGFNQKLIAISSTSGSFIDRDEHAGLAEAKEIKAFAYAQDDKLYGIDTLNRLIEIGLDDGAGVVLFNLDRKINDLAYNPHTKLLYATTGYEIVTIDPKDAKIEPYHWMSSTLKAITYDPLKNLIYVSNDQGLFQINQYKEVAPVYQSQRSIASLAYDQHKELLYAIEDESDNFISIDPKNFNRTKLLFKDFPVESTDLRAIEVHESNLYAGSKHLIVHDMTARSSSFEDFARGYRNEKSAHYEKYMTPMTKIKVETGLTYHYTQNLIYNQEGVNCLYILDVHEGNEYTPIGSEDEMDKEDLLGAENVMFRNEIYVSKVKEWEQWGLLKVSFAPILNADGDVKAIAGADINMGIIRKKTKEALFQSIAVGIIALIISFIAAFRISKKIIEPIRKLKYSALRIAAGRYGDKVLVQNPKELNELSTTFNAMDEELKDTISSLTLYNTEIQKQHREQDLQRELDQRLKTNHKQDRKSVV